jgi:hypothetical protein
MTKYQKAIDYIEKRKAIISAISGGLERGDAKWTKLYDRAVAVNVELEKAGFQIVRKRQG